jgi:superoxide dismutase, Cu-Zn family
MRGIARVYIVTRYIDTRYITRRVLEGTVNAIRRISLGIAVLGAAMALAGAFAVQSLAGGASQASAAIIDASGAPIGRARFVQDATGIVHVNVHVKGLTPGLHGIHVHAIGACGPTFAAAGGHYNPLTRQHGLLNTAGAHAGDLPNLIVNAEGVAHLDATTDRVTLTSGPTTLFDTTLGAVGSALIIHANEDDQQTDATNGGSGGRIACGVIVAG